MESVGNYCNLVVFSCFFPFVLLPFVVAFFFSYFFGWSSFLSSRYFVLFDSVSRDCSASVPSGTKRCDVISGVQCSIRERCVIRAVLCAFLGGGACEEGVHRVWISRAAHAQVRVGSVRSCFVQSGVGKVASELSWREAITIARAGGQPYGWSTLYCVWAVWPWRDPSVYSSGSPRRLRDGGCEHSDEIYCSPNEERVVRRVDRELAHSSQVCTARLRWFLRSSAIVNGLDRALAYY